MIRATLLAGLVLIAGEAHCQQNNLYSARKMAAASLHCLEVKLHSLGGAPPHFERAEYKVQVLYGKYSRGDYPNELHMLVWGAHGATAVLYEMAITDKDGKTSVRIGQWATFKMRNGALIPDELPGGVATYRRILRLVKQLSAQEPIILDQVEAQSADCQCIWTP